MPPFKNLAVNKLYQNYYRIASLLIKMVEYD